MLHDIPQRQKVIVMLAVMSALFLFALDQLIITTALGKIVEEFNSFSSLSWIITSYLLTSTITIPIAGKLSDLIGRRTVLLTGVGVFVLASLLSGLSQDITQLILFRALQGIGGGIITANAFAIIGDLFAARERGRWQGIFGGVFGIASVLGPLVGGYLTDGNNILGLTTNWRWTFWVNVPIGLAVFVIIAVFTPAIRHAAKARIDFAGSALLAIILSLVILAADNTDKIFAGFIDASGWNLAMVRTTLLVVAAVATGLFVWVERRTKEPVLSFDFFKNRNFSLFMAISVLNGAAFLGAIVYMTQFNQQVFAATPSQSGLMIIPMVFGLIFSAAISGQLMQRTGHYKNIMVTGLVIAGLGIFGLSFLTPQSSFFQEGVIMVFTGIGLGALMPTLNLAVQNEFEQKYLGTVTAATQLFRNLGSTLGTAVFGGLLTAGITASLGNIQQIPYIETLSKAPSSSSSQNFDLKKADADTALNLNTVQTKKTINEGIDKGVAASTTQIANQKIDPLLIPAPAKVEAKAKLKTELTKNIKNDFSKKQKSFDHQIKYAFSDSLRVIFYSASSLMIFAFILSLFIHEKELKKAVHGGAPGVA